MGDTANVETGLGITVTGTESGFPGQVLTGVTVKVTVALGQTALLIIGLIGLPVPELPSEPVQLKVVPAWLEFRIISGEVPEQTVYEESVVVATGRARIVTLVVPTQPPVPDMA